MKSYALITEDCTNIVTVLWVTVNNHSTVSAQILLRKAVFVYNDDHHLPPLQNISQDTNRWKTMVMAMQDLRMQNWYTIKIRINKMIFKTFIAKLLCMWLSSDWQFSIWLKLLLAFEGESVFQGWAIYF